MLVESRAFGALEYSILRTSKHGLEIYVGVLTHKGVSSIISTGFCKELVNTKTQKTFNKILQGEV